MTNSDLRQTIGKRVRDFRILNHYTQAEFAEKIDISINFLSEIENGKKGMSQETIHRLCCIFHLSADYILFGSTQNGTAYVPDVSPPKDNASSVSELTQAASSLTVRELDLMISYMSSLKKIREYENTRNTSHGTDECPQ